MKKEKRIRTRSKPSWRTVKGTEDWGNVDVQALVEDDSVYTALIYASNTVPWHRGEEEYAYLIKPGYVLLTPRGYDLDEQYSWRQDHYADPRVVATWAYDRSSAEKAQIKNLELRDFKTKYGAEFRPSRKDANKPVADENVIKQLIAEGATIDQIYRATRCAKTAIYKIYWRIMHERADA